MKYLLIFFLLSARIADAQQSPLRTSSFNELWLESIVSIELSDADGASKPLGTGFLVESPQRNLVLVTAKHVIEPFQDQMGMVTYLLTNNLGDSVRIADQKIQQAGFGVWFAAEDTDLALRFFALPAKFSGSYIPSRALLGLDALQAGAPILVLGFPLGLRDPDQGKPIVRSGNVARVDKENIIVDGFVFPGNSGGPVLYVPPIKVDDSFTSPFVNQEKLIGVVSSFIPYRERAVSQKTGRARVVFEENTGLANVLPVIEIIRLLAQPHIAELDTLLKPE